MIAISYQNSFFKMLRKYKKDVRLYRLIQIKTETFAINPNAQELKTHKLSGAMKTLYAFWIKPDLRIIFRWINETEAEFLAIGTHNEVY